MLSFKDGYDTFARVNGTSIGADIGAGYVENIEKAIDELQKALYKFSKDGRDVDQLKGIIAEHWHANTHNIDAAVKGVPAHAEVLESHVTGSVDIKGNWEDSDFGLKFFKDGNAAGQAQSEIYRAKYEIFRKNRIENGNQPVSYEGYFQQEYEKYLTECLRKNRTPQTIDEVFPGYKDPNNPLYLGQHRLIAADQLEEVRAWLGRKILEESNGGRSEQVKRYQETLDKLTDRVKSNKGSESVPISKEEAEELTRLAKEGEFDPANWELSTEKLVKFDYIMEQAFKAGLTAGVISIVLRVAPEVCGIICKLIKSGEVDAEDFKRVGLAAIKGGAEGFVRGTIAAAITSSCKAGLLGAALKTVNPSIIGALVAITMNTAKNACLMAFGKLNKHQFAERCAHDFIVTACSVGMGVAGGMIASALFTPGAAIFGFMIGSFIGSVVGEFMYKGVYSCVMALCIESGSTFFGLVEQNYELPADVLKSIGAKVFEYEKFKPIKFIQPKFEVKRFEYQKFEPIKVNVKFLRRGVIRVGAVGYV